MSTRISASRSPTNLEDLYTAATNLGSQLPNAYRPILGEIREARFCADAMDAWSLKRLRLFIKAHEFGNDLRHRENFLDAIQYLESGEGAVPDKHLQTAKALRESHGLGNGEVSGEDLSDLALFVFTQQRKGMDV